MIVRPLSNSTTLHSFRYTIHHHKEASYFCAIMMKKTSSLKFVSKDVENFPGSKMGRFLLTIHASYDGKPVSLLTTHLESCQPSTQERKNQLTRCLKKVKVIFTCYMSNFKGRNFRRQKVLREEQFAKLRNTPLEILMFLQILL